MITADQIEAAAAAVQADAVRRCEVPVDPPRRSAKVKREQP